MSTLGFRPPQFSEELAWLPPWLQQPHDPAEEPQSLSQQPFQGLDSLRGNVSKEEYLNLPSREEERYKSCHLYLSGEGNSQISSAPSPGNVLHLSLRLSSDIDSQYHRSQPLCTHGGQDGSDRILPIQQCEISKDDFIGVNVLSPTLIPRIMDNVDPQSATKKKNCREHSMYKFTVGDPEVTDAVELSIAASEALVIYELVKSGSASELLPTAAVLEAALQLKQARLESSEDIFACSVEESDDIDSLSDLDDLTMADAFEDVGLSLSGFTNLHSCASDVSLVKETPISEIHYACDRRRKHADNLTLENKSSGDLISALEISNFAGHANPMCYQSKKEISHVSIMEERVGFSVVETSVQPQVHITSSDAWDLENPVEEDKASHLVISERFRSRWFGGWTGKGEVDASVQFKQKSKNTTKCFAMETSFLSESVGIAPDENSVAHINRKSKIASEQSVPFEGLHDQADDGVLISQDVKSTNLSMVDPLCSIVPCSVSSENAASPQGQDQNCGKANAQHCFHTEKVGMENMLRCSDLKFESVCTGRQAPATTETVRRQLTSLKTFSTVPLKRDLILERKRHCNNKPLHSNLDQNMSSFRCSIRRGSEMLLPDISVPEDIIVGDTEENQNCTDIESPDTNMMNNKKNCDEHTKRGPEFQVQPSEGRRSPLILNQRMRQRLQASRLWVHSSLKIKNLRQPAAEEASNELHFDRSPQNSQSESKNPVNMQVPARTCFCFSDAQVEVQENKDLQKLQSLHRKRSARSATKRFKLVQDVKRSFLSHVKDEKKPIFQNIEFLLTGFSSIKEKEIERLVRTHGGSVLVDIPSPSYCKWKRSSRSKLQQLPVVLCSKKLQTTKFLYGCAVKAIILKVKWLTDSIAKGSAVPLGNYMVLPSQPDDKFTRSTKPVYHDNNNNIFDRVGIMLHGKHSFCSKFAKIIQHGGGRVFKTLQRLVQSLDAEKIYVGVIITEDENRASRHLRHCALERKIPMMPTSWIIRSLYSRKLLPFIENKHTRLHAVLAPEFPVYPEWSQEI